MYNCRTSNAWPRDLALTATHFPHCGMTFAVMFGCSVAVETMVVTRLRCATREATHSALMPGIFIELERSRHIKIVESITQQLEVRIRETESRPEQLEALSAAEKARRVEARKEAWLHTMYLKSHLISWNCLLVNLARHLDETQFPLADTANLPVPAEDQVVGGEDGEEVETGEQGEDHSDTCYSGSTLDHTLQGGGDLSHAELMVHTNRKIKSRIRSIIHEYNEKIRDCANRVDGMSMTTQWVSPTAIQCPPPSLPPPSPPRPSPTLLSKLVGWGGGGGGGVFWAGTHEINKKLMTGKQAQGETNVEIALSTARESQHMRSIAVVTMIFLPGTFFAVRAFFYPSFLPRVSANITSAYMANLKVLLLQYLPEHIFNEPFRLGLGPQGRRVQVFLDLRGHDYRGNHNYLVLLVVFRGAPAQDEKPQGQ